MEILILAIVAFVVAAYWVRRAQAGGSADPSLSDDLRTKEFDGGRGAVDRGRVYGGPTDAELLAPRPRRVSRESGGGKDGGG